MDKPRWHLLNKGRGDLLNIFFAGSGFDYDLPYERGVRKRLLSWHANTTDDIQQYIDAQVEGKSSFGIVDSGAFTVWNKGGVIDIDEYGKKLIELFPYFDVAANLDVIPGRKGMPASDYTPEITNQAASDGWKNYIKLIDIVKSNGFDPNRLMPIYHQGESMDWLKKMVDSGAEYIGISPSNDYATSQRQHWLDDVFDYLRSLPTLPMTHGYAVTSPVLMKQYPWMSVDSASWIQLGGFGSINTPFGIIALSDRESIMGKIDSMNGRGWSSEMKSKINSYVRSIGLDIEELKVSYKDRWRANATHMLAVECDMGYIPRGKSSSLFDELPTFEKGNKVVGNEMNDCFGMRIDDQLGEIPMGLHNSKQVK